MTYQEFFKTINEKVAKHHIFIEYNPVDGSTCRSNFKFIEFDYDMKVNIFSYTIKSTTILNSYQTMKLIQEIAQAGELIEILQELALKYGTLIFKPKVI